MMKINDKLKKNNTKFFIMQPNEMNAQQLQIAYYFTKSSW